MTQRGLQALVGEERRVDATGEIAKCLQRFVGVGFQGANGCLRPVQVSAHEHRRQADLHLQRDQVLLGSVVEVALDPAALLVLGGDQPLSGRTQIHQPCLTLIHR